MIIRDRHYNLIEGAVDILLMIGVLGLAAFLGNVIHQYIGEESWSLKDRIEAFSYISAALLVLVGAKAFVVAREQLLSTENIRLAELYNKISERWESSEVKEGRIMIFDLKDTYDTNEVLRLRIPTLGEYVNTTIKDVKLNKLGASHRSFLSLASFLEEVGLLCRKEYMRLDDISDIMGGSLVFFLEHLSPYFQDRRRQSNSKSIYANAIWLYRALKEEASFKID